MNELHPSPERNQAWGEHPLASRLRNALLAARANLQIREHLKGFAADPHRLDAVIRTLGPNHATVRDLLEITGTDASASTPQGAFEELTLV